MTTERSYDIQGMTCEHCRTAVLDEVAELSGVASAGVDLEAGVLTVRGEGVDREAIAAAVAEAGYAVRA